MHEATEPDPLVGRVLDGRFEILARLGRGGFGVVYRARQLSVNRPVAVKLLRPEWTADADVVGRFEREALLVSRLRHPGAVVVHDFGQAAEGLYIAMELLEGESLCERLATRRVLPVLDAARIGAEVARTLGEAHDLGMVHRDLKPANIFLHRVHGGGEVAKTLDFGLAALVGPERRGEDLFQTAHPQLIGSVPYMSPEQIQGLATCGKTDLYALGILLFEAVTGELPFQGPSAVDLCFQHIECVPPLLPDTLPRPFVELVGQLLEKRPEDRPPHALDVAVRLEALAGSAGPRARAAIPAAASPQALALDTTLPRDCFPPEIRALHPQSTASRRKMWRWLVVLLVAAVLGLSAWGVMSRIWPRPAQLAGEGILARGQVPESAIGRRLPAHGSRGERRAPVLARARPPARGRHLPPRGPEPPVPAARLLEGMPVPEACVAVADIPESLYLTCPLEPAEVAAFFQRHLGPSARSPLHTRHGSAVLDDPDGTGPIRMVSIALHGHETLVLLTRRNPRRTVADESTRAFGLPVMPGSVETLRTSEQLAYTAKAPLEAVVTFYEGCCGLPGISFTRKGSSLELDSYRRGTAWSTAFARLTAAGVVEIIVARRQQPEPPPPRPSTVPAGPPVDGIPLPAGATVVRRGADRLEAVVGLGVDEALRFYEWHLSRDGRQIVRSGNGQHSTLWVGEPEAPLRRVVVAPGDMGAVVEVRRSTRLVRQATAETQAFGAPVLPGALWDFEDRRTARYTTAAPIEVVVSFYRQHCGAISGVRTSSYTGREGRALLVLEASDAGTPWSRIWIGRPEERNAPAGVLEIRVTGR